METIKGEKFSELYNGGLDTDVLCESSPVDYVSPARYSLMLDTIHKLRPD